MRPLRVVVDCNVFISLLIGGSMKTLKEQLFSSKVQLILCDSLLKEVLDVGARSHLRRYFDELMLNEFVELLKEVRDVLEDPVIVPKVSRDPDDDYLLALAKTAKADVLLTGDIDLLVLGKHGRTRILNARAFVKEYL